MKIKDGLKLVESAIRAVADNEGPHPTRWAALSSVAGKIGCSPETLRSWITRAEIDSGKQPGVTTSEREWTKQLEREHRELERANEVLRQASARVPP